MAGVVVIPVLLVFYLMGRHTRDVLKTGCNTGLIVLRNADNLRCGEVAGGMGRVHCFRGQFWYAVGEPEGPLPYPFALRVIPCW